MKNDTLHYSVDIHQTAVVLFSLSRQIQIKNAISIIWIHRYTFNGKQHIPERWCNNWIRCCTTLFLCSCFTSASLIFPPPPPYPSFHSSTCYGRLPLPPGCRDRCWREQQETERQREGPWYHSSSSPWRLVQLHRVTDDFFPFLPRLQNSPSNSLSLSLPLSLSLSLSLLTPPERKKHFLLSSRCISVLSCSHFSFVSVRFLPLTQGWRLNWHAQHYTHTHTHTHTMTWPPVSDAVCSKKLGMSAYFNIYGTLNNLRSIYFKVRLRLGLD